jgi:hypothetical protein
MRDEPTNITPDAAAAAAAATTTTTTTTTTSYSTVCSNEPTRTLTAKSQSCVKCMNILAYESSGGRRANRGSQRM